MKKQRKKSEKNEKNEKKTFSFANLMQFLNFPCVCIN